MKFQSEYKIAINKIATLQNSHIQNSHITKQPHYKIAIVTKQPHYKIATLQNSHIYKISTCTKQPQLHLHGKNSLIQNLIPHFSFNGVGQVYIMGAERCGQSRLGGRSAPQPSLAAALGPLACSSRSARPPLCKPNLPH